MIDMLVSDYILKNTQELFGVLKFVLARVRDTHDMMNKDIHGESL